MTVIYHDYVVFQTTRPGLSTVKWKKVQVVSGAATDLTAWSTIGVTEVDEGQYAIKVPIENTDPFDATYIAMDTGDDAPLKRAVKAVHFDPAGWLDEQSGGGILSARVGVSSLTPKGFLEIIQGESKVITFIVEAAGRFAVLVADAITVKFGDSAGTIVVKEEDDPLAPIERVTQEFDLQVLRVTLEPEDTEALIEGVVQVEIAFDDQKARLTQSMKIIEQIAIEES